MRDEFARGATHRVSQDRAEHITDSAVTAVGDAAMLWRTFSPALAGGQRVRLGVRRAGGRVAYPTAHERDLTESLPSAPAAVRIYGSDGCCSALCFDFDAKGDHSPADAERDERILVRLLATLGLRFITDRSPGGGRHVYVPLENRMSLTPAREIIEAFGRRLPSLDPSPHRSAKTGCIRTPGAKYAAGGHQQLTMPLSVAEEAIARPNTSTEVEELRGAIAGDIRLVQQANAEAAVDTLEVDVVRIGPLTPISRRLLDIAVHGRWDVERYASDQSAARQAVITGCVAAGWMYADIASRITNGTWPGLASMYAKYRTPAQRAQAIRGDIAGAREYLALNKAPAKRRNDSVRRSNTSATLTRGGRTDYDEHAFIRTWRAVLASFEATRLSGRRFYSARFLLRALGEAAHKTGSRQVAFGVRSLAEAAGIDYSTVSVLLRDLAQHGWITKVARGWGESADVWELTVPEDLADLVTDVRWPKGKIHALRPAFRSLGSVAALVFEAVETERAHTVTELTRRLSMARSSVHDAVDLLVSWQLLERDETKRLRAFPGRLSRVAEYLGADEVVYEQMLKHREHRRLWRAWLARFESDEYVEAMDASDGHGQPEAGLEIEAA